MGTALVGNVSRAWVAMGGNEEDVGMLEKGRVCPSKGDSGEHKGLTLMEAYRMLERRIQGERSVGRPAGPEARISGVFRGLKNPVRLAPGDE